MKLLKKIGKYLLLLISLPVLYGLVALLFTNITLNTNQQNKPKPFTIFLSTNGIHLDLVLPIEGIDSTLLQNLKYAPFDQYLAFGWGDENFYLNTPTWADMTFKNAFQAMFLKSSSLIHLTRYQSTQKDWLAIEISESNLQQLNNYLENSFLLDAKGQKMILANQGYGIQDDFYKAKGSYSCFNTCNTWVNSGFKESGLKACFWTPFDFGLMGKHN